MRIKRDTDEGFEIQMAPLIDCMFILLIFFLVTTTLKKIEKEVPLELPFADASVDVSVPQNMTVISIDAVGQVYLQGDSVSTALLLDHLAKRAAEDPEQRIRIDADQSTDYQYLIEVIEACKLYGLHNIGLHTRAAR